MEVLRPQQLGAGAQRRHQTALWTAVPFAGATGEAGCGTSPFYTAGLATRSASRQGPIDGPSPGGYTWGMKTAVSIPDEVFEEAERLASELQTSRSQLYSRALQEFMARHVPDRLTEAMNRVVEEVGSEIDEFSQRASRRVLEQVEW